MALLLALALVCLSASSVSGLGTVIELYDYTNGPSKGLNPVWVTPNPLSGPKPGCANLPTGFVPRSGKFTWRANNAVASLCSFVVFFFKPNCEIPEDGPNMPAVKASTSATTTINNFAVNSLLSLVPKAVSVGCSFAVDPCVSFPCGDPNARCISKTFTIVNVPNVPNGVVANNTRDCSTCKSGFSLVSGKCTDVCAGVVCPTGSKCGFDAASQTATCVCPSGQKFDAATNKCVSAAQDLWLPLITALRAANGINTPLLWDTTVEAAATAHATSVRDAQCVNSPSPTLALLRSSLYSENNAFTSGTQAESAAFDLWTQPNPTNTAVKFIGRMVNAGTKQVGCGKALCGWGAFYTCLFTPRTI